MTKHLYHIILASVMAICLSSIAATSCSTADKNRADCDIASLNSGSNPDSNALQRRLTDTISEIVSRYPAEIGVAIIIGDTGTVAVNDRNIYPMMSVFKLHQALALCHSLDEKGIGLDSLVTIHRNELDPDTWSPMLKEHSGPEFSLTLKDLLRYTLSQSDNNASNLMFKRIVGVSRTDSFIATLIPRSSFRISFSEEDMSADHSKAYSNSTSPRGAAMLINRLFTDSLVSADKQDFIKETLRECITGTDRIIAPLKDKDGVIVAHKTGSGYSSGGILAAHNDVAYITLPDGTGYSLAVFVKDLHGDESLASEAISAVSSAAYSLIAATQLPSTR